MVSKSKVECFGFETNGLALQQVMAGGEILYTKLPSGSGNGSTMN
jgi:hypothetical protein